MGDGLVETELVVVGDPELDREGVAERLPVPVPLPLPVGLREEE